MTPWAKPVDAPVLRRQPASTDTLLGGSQYIALEKLWSVRLCFLCQQPGNCGHREPDVDLAELEAVGRAMRGGKAAA